MSACVKHDEDKFFIVLFPYKQPIRLDVTLPLSITVAMKLMNAVFFGKCLAIE